MIKLLRNVIAIVVGVAFGGAVNMALVMLGPSIVPPPAGVDASDAASLAANIHLFEPRHFLMPFLAHALGTFAGALAAYLIAASARAALAWVIGAVFLCGGIAASFMIPAPGWFIALDLLLAYLPMAGLAIRLGAQLSPAGVRPP